MLWDRWIAAHPTASATIDARFYPGAKSLLIPKEFWASEFDLGPIQIKGIPVQREVFGSETTGEDFAARLGIYGLMRVNLVIDGPNGKVYVRANQDPPPSYPHNRLGAVFVPENLQSNPLIAHVLPASPAFAAGLRNGDILVKVGDLDVRPWPTTPGITPLGRFWLQPAGTVLNLTVRRGEQELVLRAKLQDLLGPQRNPAEP